MPNKNCKDCGGTGRIVLFTSSRKCGCSPFPDFTWALKSPYESIDDSEFLCPRKYEYKKYVSSINPGYTKEEFDKLWENKPYE
jgi:hypothetical protein